MKKNLITVLLMGLMTIPSLAQNQVIDLVSPTNSDLFRRNLSSANKYNKVIGTPYLIPYFSLATVSGVKDFVLVRYNAESDEIEIDNGEDKFYILPKNEEYAAIDFNNSMYKFRLVDYKDSKGNTNGYLIEKFSGNNIALYKKEKIILTPSKQAANSYQSDTPAQLNKVAPKYYLKFENSTAEFPSNKKKLIALLPSKKEIINTYFKENKLSFSNENDIIKIAQFLDSL